MGFSRQEYWSQLPFPSPGDLPNPGIEPRSPALQANSLPTELQGKQRTSCEMLGWMEHKLESRLPGEIYYPYGRKQRGTEEPLDEGERGE